MAIPTQNVFGSTQVAETFERYPEKQRKKLLILRQLILDTASEIKIDDLEETLKWGEPSYLTSKGSTIRLAWRKSKPGQYGIFFNCKTTLVETFREIYPGIFTYEGNRAIIFEADDKIPLNELTQCIELSLCYHRIKHLPMLGL